MENNPTKEQAMTEKQFTDQLRQLLDEADGLLGNPESQSFREAGVFTDAEGLVVRTDDGSEFQLTVVKSA